MSLDGAGDSQDQEKSGSEEFVDGNEVSERNEVPDGESSERAKPTETPEVINWDDTLARAMQEKMNMTADEELAQDSEHGQQQP